MSSSSVFWNMFMETGAIGLYLLYKYVNDPGSEVEAEGEIELDEVAFERG